MRVCAKSENQLQTELQIAGTARVADLSHARASDLGIGNVKGRRVGGVERFGAELSPDSLGDAELLVQRQIEVGQRRASDQVAGGVSERERGVAREGGGVEPTV